MSALFRWAERTQIHLELGQVRTVTKFIWWPECLDGEWRWLGRERVTQEVLRLWSHAPEGIGSFDYNGWADRHWGGTA